MKVSNPVPWLHVATLFLGALLLFAIQPMVGRMLLPRLGGSPSVWNACLVFFQGMLLLGYLYSHALTRWTSPRGQAAVHLAVVVAGGLALPIVIPAGTPPTDSPMAWLFGVLLAGVGLPFFVAATTSPMLQRWYASSRARGASDPYFLSVASNAGCLLALLAYPLLLEPSLSLREQASWWRVGYLAYLVFILGCALRLVQAGRGSSTITAETAVPDPLSQNPVRPGYWLLLSLIPSSLLVGVTQTLTTDLAPIPLLWVVPLGLYLVTFILAFLPGVRLPLARLGRTLVMSVVFLSLALLTGATEPLPVVLLMHLTTFFLAALVCHGRLAGSRPPVRFLTGFYLWISLGGVLGGAFNALLAPILFHRLGFVEYPLALLAVCLLRPTSHEQFRWRWTDLGFPIVLASLTLAFLLASRSESLAEGLSDLAENLAMHPDMLRRAICFGLPLVLAFLLIDRPVRFVLGLAGLFLVGSLESGATGRLLYLERNFLGVVKITRSPDGQFIRMVHGNTVHGQQRLAPRPATLASFLQPLGSSSPLGQILVHAAADGRWDERTRPLTYYHPTGPAGITFRHLVDQWDGPRRIAVVGLGTGALASYGRPNQDWTFFELDPAVERLARDPRYFTFLRDSRAARLEVVLGDARLRLAEQADHSFDLLVLDAFSSDAIPIHLLTAEAFALYERKLAPGGVILMHLSNRYLNLVPVVARIAQTAEPRLVIRENSDIGISDREMEDGKYPSVWVILARTEEDFGKLRTPLRGFTGVSPSNAPRWTDDRADLLRAFRREE